VHRVHLERAAEADLRALPGSEFERAVQRIKALAEDPRFPGCRKIAGSRSDWRVRMGAYRIIYEVDDAERTVTVIRVRHRHVAYR